MNTNNSDAGNNEEGSDAMSEFFTRENANAGVKFPLHNAAGILTEHWLRILGVDSDEFRAADTIAKREAVKAAAIEDEVTRDNALKDITRKLIASLISEWSFSKPCTKANIIAFLREAPQFEKAIDNIATRRSLFFANASSSSVST